MLEKLEVKTYKTLWGIIVLLFGCCVVLIFALKSGATFEMSKEKGIKFTPRNQNREIISLQAEMDSIKRNTIKKEDYNKLVAKVISLHSTCVELSLLSPNKTYKKSEEICDDIDHILRDFCYNKSEIDILLSIIENKIRHKGLIYTNKNDPYIDQIQKILDALDYEKNDTTTTTYQAVRRFQQDSGIKIDGKVGVNTIAKLKESWKNKKQRL